ncbi:MAG: shikimate dehydrogenase [Verrucomicrobiota bacterium]|nr:shikimate dehydrogenase [Verrucomicrobiota bacterium]
MDDLFQNPIGAATCFCAVYGQPIRHSGSPAMHNPALAKLGLDWRYLAFEVSPDALGQAIEGARAMHFVGINLTVPHKLLAIELVDVLDESATTWGAVNTICFEAKNDSGDWTSLGQLPNPATGKIRAKGHNTDADAIALALREDLGLRLGGQRVLLLGAGGAGRVAALKLAAEGVAELHLVNRTVAKAEQLAGEIAERFPQTKAFVGYPENTDDKIDLLLNATSLGLKPEDALPLDESKFSLSNAPAVFDMVYQPAVTPLLARANNADCRTANGLGMLLWQGAKALEIWTGQPAPIDLMRTALESHIYCDE